MQVHLNSLRVPAHQGHCDRWRVRTLLLPDCAPTDWGEKTKHARADHHQPWVAVICHDSHENVSSFVIPMKMFPLFFLHVQVSVRKYFHITFTLVFPALFPYVTFLVLKASCGSIAHKLQWQTLLRMFPHVENL